MTAELVHGTRAMYRRGGCREECCRAAMRVYNKRYAALRRRGLTSMVDAAPVRAHVLWLAGYGISLAATARAAGVPEQLVRRLIDGVPSKGRAPSQRLRRSHAEAILRVERVVDNVTDLARTPARETRDRLRSLVASGRTQSELANRLGMNIGQLNHHLLGHHEGVSGRFARRVRDLHAELAGQEPPRATTADRIRYGQALAVARKRGWLVEQVAS